MRRKHAFTLVELLIVIAIIGVLVDYCSPPLAEPANPRAAPPAPPISAISARR